MTAEGELYLDEDCRDFFSEELNKIFGDCWRINANDFCNCWDLSQIPRFCEVKIVNCETNKLLGIIEIENEFDIEDWDYGRFIIPTPKSFKLISKI